MKKQSLLLLTVVILLAFASTLFIKTQADFPKNKRDLTILNKNEEGETEEMEQENSRRRAEFEWTLLRDPKTGKIPQGIREKEMDLLIRCFVQKLRKFIFGLGDFDSHRLGQFGKRRMSSLPNHFHCGQIIPKDDFLILIDIYYRRKSGHVQSEKIEE